jgi:hypothetical protein
MNFIVNINGDSYETLAGNLTDLLNALSQVEKALPKTAPHGRNYLAQREDPEAFSEDMGAYRAALQAYWVLRNYADSIGHCLAAQQPD